jgi:hypothetical protein
MIRQDSNSVIIEAPRRVKVVSWLYFISASFLVILALSLLAADVLLFMFFLLMGGINVLLGIKLWQGRNWARIIILIFTWIIGIFGLITLIGAIIPAMIIYTLQFEKRNIAFFTKEPYHDEDSTNKKLKDEVERLKYHAEKLKLEKEIKKMKKSKV